MIFHCLENAPHHCAQHAAFRLKALLGSPGMPFDLSSARLGRSILHNDHAHLPWPWLYPHTSHNAWWRVVRRTTPVRLTLLLGNKRSGDEQWLLLVANTDIPLWPLNALDMVTCHRFFQRESSTWQWYYMTSDNSIKISWHVQISHLCDYILYMAYFIYYIRLCRV